MSPNIKQACSEITEDYQGLTTNELLTFFKLSDKKSLKSACYTITDRMFTKRGFDKKVLQQDNIILKTLVLSPAGGRTEDMKLFRIYFDEIQNPNLKFVDSSFYKFFSEKQILCAIFKENPALADLHNSEFLGLKNLSFSEDYIFNEVYKTWSGIRKLILTSTLKNVSTQSQQTKRGDSSAPNFPKSSTNKVFVRGGGINSKDKTEIVNGVKMYKQYVWIRGRDIVSDLEKIPFVL